MQSLTDLNGYSDTEIEVTDDRLAKVLFDRAGSIDITDAISSTTVVIEQGFEIEEIINYATANVRYQIKIQSTDATFITNSTIAFPTPPAYVTLSTATSTFEKTFTLTGLRKVSDWDTVKAATWTLWASFASVDVFNAEVSVVYYDEELGSDVSNSYLIYDPLNYYLARLQSEAQLYAGGFGIKGFAVSMNAVSSLTANVREFFVDSEFALTATVQKLKIAEAAFTADSGFNISEQFFSGGRATLASVNAFSFKITYDVGLLRSNMVTTASMSIQPVKTARGVSTQNAVATLNSNSGYLIVPAVAPTFGGEFALPDIPDGRIRFGDTAMSAQSTQAVGAIITASAVAALSTEGAQLSIVVITARPTADLTALTQQNTLANYKVDNTALITSEAALSVPVIDGVPWNFTESLAIIDDNTIIAFNGNSAVAYRLFSDTTNFRIHNVSTDVVYSRTGSIAFGGGSTFIGNTTNTITLYNSSGGTVTSYSNTNSRPGWTGSAVGSGFVYARFTTNTSDGISSNEGTNFEMINRSNGNRNLMDSTGGDPDVTTTINCDLQANGVNNVAFRINDNSQSPVTYKYDIRSKTTNSILRTFTLTGSTGLNTDIVSVTDTHYVTYSSSAGFTTGYTVRRIDNNTQIFQLDFPFSDVNDVQIDDEYIYIIRDDEIEVLEVDTGNHVQTIVGTFKSITPMIESDRLILTQTYDGSQDELLIYTKST